MNSPKRVQLTLRVTKTLDEQLTAQAQKLGVSKNAYISMLLSRVPEVEQSMKEAKPHEHTA
ncbi:MAG: toxin-antitoxin system HicB family antitoxin [Alicyclobacillaceae bacterium]|nr:toxin-antitoxin system HicB family antitoxin [Alicyclobacillaceae bacterium]